MKFRTLRLYAISGIAGSVASVDEHVHLARPRVRPQSAHPDGLPARTDDECQRAIPSPSPPKPIRVPTTEARGVVLAALGSQEEALVVARCLEHPTRPG